MVSCATSRKPASIVETKVLKSSVVYPVKGFGIKTPALFISTSIRPNRDTAVSTIAAAVSGAMSPSTSATFAAAANGLSFVVFREFATKLYPRFKNASTNPAPIPRDAPVTIAVFVIFAICQIRFQRPGRANLALVLGAAGKNGAFCADGPRCGSQAAEPPTLSPWRGRGKDSIAVSISCVRFSEAAWAS